MSELVTVAVVNFPHEVQMIRDRLEGEGIFVVTRGEALGSTGGNYLSDSGIWIQVRQEDADVAHKSLRQIESTENDNTSTRRNILAFIVKILVILVFAASARQFFSLLLPDWLTWSVTIASCVLLWKVGHQTSAKL